MRRYMNFSGDITRCVVPSRHGIFRFSSTCQAALHCIVGTLDNFLRPVLICMGADLPLLLIFGSVIGGLFAFGLVRIFVGPVVLAVSWMLLDAWMDEETEAPPSDGSVQKAPPPAPP